MVSYVGPSFLDYSKSQKLIFFGGKGGVGKTTCACATALRLAEGKPDQQYLLISTDPAHSVLNTYVDVFLPENLEICELDAANSLGKFKEKHEQVLKEIGERGTFLDDEDLQGILNLSLPGMDELAAYLEIANWLQQRKYHTIIIDTAPTGHTLRLLEMPNLVRRWLVGLDTLLAKHRYIRRHFTGDTELDHLDRFLVEMDSSVLAIENLMNDQEICQFVIVMVAESMIVEESIDLALALAEKNVPVPEIVINQFVPANDCLICDARRNQQLIAINRALDRFGNPRFWTLPLLSEEPRAKSLTDLWSHFSPLEQIGIISPSSFKLPFKVDFPATLPASSVKL